MLGEQALEWGRNNETLLSVVHGRTEQTLREFVKSPRPPNLLFHNGGCTVTMCLWGQREPSENACESPPRLLNLTLLDNHPFY